MPSETPNGLQTAFLTAEVYAPQVFGLFARMLMTLRSAFCGSILISL
ncbi:TPA: hypothetical protein WIF11_001928, partial [Neisseria meningitidis]